MDQKPAKRYFAAFFSVLYLIAAASLLFTVCGHCYPQLGQKLRQAVAGSEHSAVQEAFSTLTNRLEAGDGFSSALRGSYEVLIGEAAAD